MMNSQRLFLLLFVLASTPETVSFILPQHRLPSHQVKHGNIVPIELPLLVKNSRISPLTRSSSTQVSAVPPMLDDISSVLASCDGLNSMLMAADTKNKIDFLKSFVAFSLIMLALLAIIFGFQRLTDNLRFRTPLQLRPVMDSISTQIAGLGVTTLALQGALSLDSTKRFLKDTCKSLDKSGVHIQISPESINLMQQGFMELGVAVAIAAALMILAGLKQLRDIEELQNLTLDRNTGQCTVSPEVLSAYLTNNGVNNKGRRNNEPLPGNVSVWREIFRNPKERAARTLVMRIKIMELYPYLSNNFRVESLILDSFTDNLYRITQFLNRNPIPLFVTFFIPAMAGLNTVLATSPVYGSSLHVGEFVTNAYTVWPWTASVVFGGMWGNWNCYKMTQIKKVVFPRLSLGSESFPLVSANYYGRPYDMNYNFNNNNNNIPGLVAGGNIGTRPAILTPLMDDPGFRQYYDISGNEWTERIERIWAKPAQTWFDATFGTAGAAGLDLYRSSIQYQVSLCLTQLIVFGTMIIPRDIELLTSTAAATASATTLALAKAELFVYGGYVAITLLQLFLVAPRAFWNFCLVACLQEDGSQVGSIPPSSYSSISVVPEVVSDPARAGTWQ